MLQNRTDCIFSKVLCDYFTKAVKLIRIEFTVIVHPNSSQKYLIIGLMELILSAFANDMNAKATLFTCRDYSCSAVRGQRKIP